MNLNSKVSASALVVDDADRYLVVRRAKEPEMGKWDLPGGFCEYGEAPMATARRETREESGYEVEVQEILGAWPDSYAEPDGSFWPTINLIYLAQAVNAAEAQSSPDLGEVDDVRWVPLARPPADLAFASQQIGALNALNARRKGFGVRLFGSERGFGG